LKEVYKDNPKIRKIWGKEVYKLVVGKTSALKETWNALPKAISDTTKSKSLDEKDAERLKKFFSETFK